MHGCGGYRCLADGNVNLARSSRHVACGVHIVCTRESGRADRDCAMHVEPNSQLIRQVRSRLRVECCKQQVELMDPTIVACHEDGLVVSQRDMASDAGHTLESGMAWRVISLPGCAVDLDEPRLRTHLPQIGCARHVEERVAQHADTLPEEIVDSMLPRAAPQ